MTFIKSAIMTNCWEKARFVKEQDINFPEDFVERYKDLREKCNSEILASNNQKVRLAVEHT